MQQNEPTQEEEETRPKGVLGVLRRWESDQDFPVFAGILVGALLCIPLSIGIVSYYQDELNRTDPRVGVVKVKDSTGRTTGVSKVCDGTTLVYSGGLFGSDEVIPESSECG